MIQTQGLIFSFFIFLITLLLYQTIFFALLVVLFFLGGLFLINYFWDFRRPFMVTFFVKPVTNIVLSSLSVVFLFFLVFLPLEFILSEIKYVTPKLPDFFSLGTLFLFIFIFSFFPWKKYFNYKLFFFSMFLFFSLALITSIKYRSEKILREYLPKIYSMSPNWTIQAQIIKIQGINFGQTWEKGKLIYGKESKEMVIREWGEKMIIAEQPVPSSFGRFELRVLRSDGIKSNPITFEIMNPDILQKNDDINKEPSQ